MKYFVAVLFCLFLSGCGAAMHGGNQCDIIRAKSDMISLLTIIDRNPYADEIRKVQAELKCQNIKLAVLDQDAAVPRARDHHRIEARRSQLQRNIRFLEWELGRIGKKSSLSDSDKFPFVQKTQ